MNTGALLLVLLVGFGFSMFWSLRVLASYIAAIYREFQRRNSN